MATTEIYTYCHTLSLHDALPIDAGVDRKYGFLGSDRPSHEQALLHCRRRSRNLEVASQRLSRPIMDRKYHDKKIEWAGRGREWIRSEYRRSEEHTSELQSLMRISYAVFCFKKKRKQVT